MKLLTEFISDGAPDAEERVLEKERDRMVWDAVGALPEKLKTVVLLYYMEGLDELLTHALTPREEPGDILNRKILNKVKERDDMKQKKYKRASAAETVTAGESQSYGGYKATALGILSGENLSEFERRSGGSVRSDRTYCAVAIEREDGTAMNEGGNFFVSPLIGGLEPWKYNAASLCGNYSEFVENGVLYRLLECDNIEYFADHQLYLCVADTSFYNTILYRYNEEDGSIGRNAEYQGLNALFELEMDASLADPVRAQALIDEINSPSEGGMEMEMPAEAKEAMEWVGKLTSESLGRYCVRMEDTVQTVTVALPIIPNTLPRKNICPVLCIFTATAATVWGNW